MRILYVTTVGGMMGFFKSFIARLIKEGHTVDIACNDTESVPEEYRKLVGSINGGKDNGKG